MVNVSYRRYLNCLFFCLAFTAALGLTGCGKNGDGASGSGYTVALELPPPPDNNLQHLGRMVLRIEGRREPREIEWAAGSTQNVEFDEDETLTFSAYSVAGPLYMTGSVRVGDEKKVIIPLRKVE